MKKICLFIHNLGGGGAERAFVNLANGLAARGLSVDLALIKAEGPYLAEVSQAVRVVHIRTPWLPGLNILSMIWATIVFARYIRTAKPVAVLSAFPHLNVSLVLARIFSRGRVFVAISERSTVSLSHGNLSPLRRVIQGTLMRVFYPFADVVVGVSDGVCDDLRQFLKKPNLKTRTIYNPVIDAHMEGKSREAAPHPWIAGDRQRPVVLAAGRMAPSKGFETLLPAFARLRAHKDARLIILGQGDMRPRFEAMVADLGLEEHVSMPGFFPNPFSFMARCDCFVLSSRWEGLPNVLIQAMACGAPVVSTDCPSGPREILEGGKWGKLVPVGDAEALAAAMLDVLDNPPPSARARAMDFTVDKAVDAYLELLLRDEAGPYLTRARAA
jgi:glycosyltransferase involved in cell wall biosynthesis